MRAIPILCILLLLLPASALAQRGPGLRTGACRADIERLCPDAGRGRETGRCLKERRAELSEACAAAFAEQEAKMQGRAAAVREACADEVAKLCPDAQPGQGGLLRCLRSHDAELSGSCRDALPQRRGPGGRRP